MDLTDFGRGFKRLASAYDKKLSAEQAEIYHDQFAALTVDQWFALVHAAIGNLDRFPSVSTLRTLAVDLRLLRREFNAHGSDDRPSPWIEVVCGCGRSFAFRRDSDAIDLGCPSCRTFYAASDLRRNADRGVVLVEPFPENVHRLAAAGGAR
jgi:hypothetical protein